MINFTHKLEGNTQDAMEKCKKCNVKLRYYYYILGKTLDTLDIPTNGNSKLDNIYDIKETHFIKGNEKVIHNNFKGIGPGKVQDNMGKRFGLLTILYLISIQEQEVFTKWENIQSTLVFI